MSTSKTDEKISLKHSQLNLAKHWEKFQDISEKITILTRLLQTTNADLFIKKSMLLDNLLAELCEYKRIYVHLTSLIGPAHEKVGENNTEMLLQSFCLRAQQLTNAEHAVAVSLDPDKKIGHVVTSSNKKLTFNSEAFDADFIHSICQHQSAFIHSQASQLTMQWHQEQFSDMLLAPLLTQNQVYGFAYLLSKADHQPFNDLDIHLIDTHARSFAMSFENIEFSTLIKQQGLQLQSEIIKLQNANAELYKNKVALRQLAENIDDVFWRTSSNSDRIIYINPRDDAVWEQSSNLFYKDPLAWQDWVVEEDKIKVKSFFKNIVENAEDSSLEYRIKHPKGTIRNIYNKTICLKDDAGKLHQIISIASDITEYLLNK